MPKSRDDLLVLIADESSLEPLQLEQVSALGARVGALFDLYDAGGVVWKIGEPVPGGPPFNVFGIFEVLRESEQDPGGDLHVYCCPLLEGAPYAVYTLSRRTPPALRLLLSEAAFVHEVAAEFEGMSERFKITDEDPGSEVQCLDCGVFTETTVDSEDDDPDPRYCGGCGHQLPIEAEVIES